MQYGKIQIWSIQKALTSRNQKDSSTKILSLTLRFCRFPLWSNVFISKFVAALKATEFKPFTLVILLYFLHPTIKWFPFHLSLLFSSAFFLCQAWLWGFFWPFSFLFFPRALQSRAWKWLPWSPPLPAAPAQSLHCHDGLEGHDSLPPGNLPLLRGGLRWWEGTHARTKASQTHSVAHTTHTNAHLQAHPKVISPVSTQRRRWFLIIY